MQESENCARSQNLENNYSENKQEPELSGLGQSPSQVTLVNAVAKCSKALLLREKINNKQNIPGSPPGLGILKNPLNEDPSTNVNTMLDSSTYPAKKGLILS